MSSLVDAHIEAQANLRRQSAAAIAAAWAALPNYDQASVPEFLAFAVPVTVAAQRASVNITAAYLARALEGPPVPVDAAKVMQQVRAGTPPAEVYRRPFVNVWTALKDGHQYSSAVASGLERATSAAEMDVQLAMRQTLVDVAKVDKRILGYRRVPDPGACAFCRLVAGQRYTIAQLMPVHNRCGCGVDVITAANRDEFTGNRANDLSVAAEDVTVAVREHGELGPLLVDAADHFTHL